MDERALRELDSAMARLAEGDRSACEGVFSALWPELVSFAERSLGRGPDVDDIAQRALEKIFAQATAYDPARSAFAWALAITAWECRTVRKRRARQREDPLERASNMPSSALDPENAALEASIRAALQGAMATLSPSDRSTLEVAFFEEANQPRSPAFRKRKERAVNRLRAAWRKLHG